MTEEIGPLSEREAECLADTLALIRSARKYRRPITIMIQVMPPGLIKWFAFGPEAQRGRATYQKFDK